MSTRARFPEPPTHRYSRGDETDCGIWIRGVVSITMFDNLVTCARPGCR